MKYTKEDVISIIDFAKDKNIKSNQILQDWHIEKNNTIEEKDEHGLSIVSIFEHTIAKDNKDIGEIIVFKYSGVGGGWENDIFEMVEKKYFSDETVYTFMSDDEKSYYYRFFLTGSIFEDKYFDDESIWERPNNTKKFRIFKQELPKSELLILYDTSSSGEGINMRNKLEGRFSEYNAYWDNSACMYYIKNISSLEFKPIRPIIEERINNRKK